MAAAIKRFDLFLVALDPTVGSEIQKTRPCLVISPDEANRHIATVIVAPMTSRGRSCPTRIPCQFGGKPGLVVLDQFRTVDKLRLVKCLGQVTPEEQKTVLDGLAGMLAD